MSSSRFWLVIDQSLKEIISGCDVIVMAIGILSLSPRPSSYSVLFLNQENVQLWSTIWIRVRYGSVIIANHRRNCSSVSSSFFFFLKKRLGSSCLELLRYVLHDFPIHLIIQYKLSTFLSISEQRTRVNYTIVPDLVLIILPISNLPVRSLMGSKLSSSRV